MPCYHYSSIGDSSIGDSSNYGSSSYDTGHSKPQEKLRYDVFLCTATQEYLRDKPNQHEYGLVNRICGSPDCKYCQKSREYESDSKNPEKFRKTLEEKLLGKWDNVGKVGDYWDTDKNTVDKAKDKIDDWMSEIIDDISKEERLPEERQQRDDQQMDVEGFQSFHAQHQYEVERDYQNRPQTGSNIKDWEENY